MTETRYFGELEVQETDPNFETANAYPIDHEEVHHRRVSAVFETEAKEELSHIVIKDFVDEETGHGNWNGWHAIEVAVDELDELIDGLETIRLTHAME